MTSGSEKSLEHTKVHSSTHTKYMNASEMKPQYNQNFDMFLWTSGFQNPLVHTDFDMFVDE